MTASAPSLFASRGCATAKLLRASASGTRHRLDDGVAREARRDRFEIRDFAGRTAAGHSVPPRQVRAPVRWVPQFYADKTAKRFRLQVYCLAAEGGSRPLLTRTDPLRDNPVCHVGSE